MLCTIVFLLFISLSEFLYFIELNCNTNLFYRSPLSWESMRASNVVFCIFCIFFPCKNVCSYFAFILLIYVFYSKLIVYTYPGYVYVHYPCFFTFTSKQDHQDHLFCSGSSADVGR